MIHVNCENKKDNSERYKKVKVSWNSNTQRKSTMSVFVFILNTFL